jgi:hypothetical protein
MACSLRLNNIGVLIKVTINDCGTDSAVDISTATTKQLIFTKPSGTKVTKSASFFTTGTDGILTYTTVSGDLDEIGTWQFQGYVVIGTNEFTSTIDTFKVERNL